MERKSIEVVIMVGVFVIVVGCFSVPIIIYAMYSQPRDHDHVTATTRDVLYTIDVNNCSEQVAIALYIVIYTPTGRAGSYTCTRYLKL